MSRITAIYRIRSDAASIEARAQAIAVEQSVEMPLSAIVEPEILRDIVGQVEAIEDRGGGVFDVRIGLATATVGHDAGQFLNMVFGNTSLHDGRRAAGRGRSRPSSPRHSAARATASTACAAAPARSAARSPARR